MNNGNGPMYPIVAVSSHGLNNQNDSRHNKTDPNKGGGPTIRTRRMVPNANRGGFGQHGQRRTADAANSTKGRTRSNAPNPARGKFPGDSRGGAFKPESRIPGHGGSPQRREKMPPPRGGGFGKQGQGKENTHAPGQLPSYGSTDPMPGAGNMSGRMQKRIAGRFQQDSKGRKASGAIGAFGSDPVDEYVE